MSDILSCNLIVPPSELQLYMSLSEMLARSSLFHRLLYSTCRSSMCMRRPAGAWVLASCCCSDGRPRGQSRTLPGAPHVLPVDNSQCNGKSTVFLDLTIFKGAGWLRTTYLDTATFAKQCFKNVSHSSIYEIDVHRALATATFTTTMRPER